MEVRIEAVTEMRGVAGGGLGTDEERSLKAGQVEVA